MILMKFNEDRWILAILHGITEKAVEMDKEFLLFYTPDGNYRILHEKHRIQLNFMIFM